MIPFKTGLRRFGFLFASLLIALLLGAVLFHVTGHNALHAYQMMLRGSLGSPGAMQNTLFQATPVILTGLAFVVAIKSGIVNIGAEGQLMAGAMAAAIVGHYVTAPAFVHVPLAVLAACAVGGLCGALIAFLKVRFGAHAVITAIMLNHIINNFTSYLVNFPLLAEGANMGYTERIQPTAHMPLLRNMLPIPAPYFQRLSVGILLAVLVPVGVWFLFKYTRAGFEMRVTGRSLDAANTAGIKSGKRMVQALFLSGAIAGLAGAIEILGSMNQFVDRFSPGWGFDGIAVAFLSGLNFIGVVFSGLFFGALSAGSIHMQIFARIPIDYVNVIQAIVIMLVAAPRVSEYLYSFVQKKRKKVPDGL
jgi:simple sugar transport system permease protein